MMTVSSPLVHVDLRMMHRSLATYAATVALVLGATGQRTSIRQVGGCGQGCTFWMDGQPHVTATLSREGACGENCISLTFSSTGIVAIDGSTFYGLPELRMLNLGSNAIESIPADAFKMNPKLQYLDLSNNSIRSIPSDIFRFNPDLRLLVLSDNTMELQYVDADTFRFSHLVRVIGLRQMPPILSDNANPPPTWTPAPDSGPGTGLRTPITQSATSGCGGCTFWLVGEPYVNATLSKEGSCENCTALHLCCRGIVNISGGTFHGLPKLERLYLHSNAIQSIPADAITFWHNPRLQYLSLSNNSIQSIPAQAISPDMLWVADRGVVLEDNPGYTVP